MQAEQAKFEEQKQAMEADAARLRAELAATQAQQTRME